MSSAPTSTEVTPTAPATADPTDDWSSVISDPRWDSLDMKTKSDMAQKYFDQNITTNPLYSKLDGLTQAAMRVKFVADSVPGSPEADAWKRRQAIMWGAAEQGGSAAIPLLPGQPAPKSTTERIGETLQAIPATMEGNFYSSIGRFYSMFGKVLPPAVQQATARYLGIPEGITQKYLGTGMPERAPFAAPMSEFGKSTQQFGQQEADKALPEDATTAQQAALGAAGGVAALPADLLPYITPGRILQMTNTPAMVRTILSMAAGNAALAEPGQEGKAALSGAITGVPMHYAGEIYNPALRVGANAATFAGATAAEGGTPGQIGASAILGGAMGIPGQKAPLPELPVEKPKPPVTNQEIAIRTSPEAATKYKPLIEKLNDLHKATITIDGRLAMLQGYLGMEQPAMEAGAPGHASLVAEHVFGTEGTDLPPKYTADKPQDIMELLQQVEARVAQVEGFMGKDLGAESLAEVATKKPKLTPPADWAANLEADAEKALQARIAKGGPKLLPAALPGMSEQDVQVSQEALDAGKPIGKAIKVEETPKARPTWAGYPPVDPAEMIAKGKLLTPPASMARQMPGPPTVAELLKANEDFVAEAEKRVRQLQAKLAVVKPDADVKLQAAKAVVDKVPEVPAPSALENKAEPEALPPGWRQDADQVTPKGTVKQYTYIGTDAIHPQSGQPTHPTIAVNPEGIYGSAKTFSEAVDRTNAKFGFSKPLPGGSGAGPEMTTVYSGIPVEVVEHAIEVLQDWLTPRKDAFSDKLDLRTAPPEVQHYVTSPPEWLHQLPLVLYSQLPNKGTPESFGRVIESALREGKFKPEPLQRSNIQDWLQSLPKGSKVTRAEVLQKIAENTTPITRSARSQTEWEPTPEEQVARRKVHETAAAYKKLHDEAYDLVHKNSEWAMSSSEIRSLIMTARGIYSTEFRGTSADRDEFISTTKFDRYAPRAIWEKLAAAYDAYLEAKNTAQDVKAAVKAQRAALGQFTPKYEIHSLPSGEDYTEHVVSTPPDEARYGGNYESPHWEEQPNVIYHSRETARKDASGRSLLFSEEIQSDLHQKGRTEGYSASKTEQDRLGDQVDLAHDKLADFVHEHTKDNDSYVKEWEGILWPSKTREKSFRDSLSPEDQKTFDSLQEDWNRAIDQHQSASQGHPRLPYAKTWPEVALTDLLKRAVAAGKQAVGWTTGKTQVDRWGSEEILWRKNPEGEGWQVSVKSQSGGELNGQNLEDLARIHGLLNKDDRVVKTKESLRKFLYGLLSADHTDKEILKIADRAWTRMQEVSTGHLLPRKEGLEAFYDKMLVDTMNKLVKRWGVKVEAGSVATTERFTGPEIPVQIHEVPITPEMAKDIPKMINVYSGIPTETLEHFGEKLRNWLSPREGYFSAPVDLREAPQDVRRLVAAVAAGHKELKATGQTPSSRNQSIPMKIREAHETPETMFMYLDNDFNGAGIATEKGYNAILRGMEVTNSLKRDAQQTLYAIFDKAGLQDVSKRLEMSSFYGGRGATVGTLELPDAGKIKATPAQILGAYAALGDTNTVGKILGGTKYNRPEDRNAVPQELTSRDIRAINTWVEGQPALAQMVKDLKAAMLVTREPLFDVVEKLKGGRRPKTYEGYWPRHRNNLQEVPEDSLPTPEAVFDRKLENLSIVQPRSDSDLPLLLFEDIFHTWHNYMDNAATIRGLAEPVNTATKLFTHPASRLAIERVHGRETLSNIENYLKAVANPGTMQSATLAEKFFKGLQRNVGRSFIQANPTTVAMQFGGVMRLSSEIPLKYFLPALQDMASPEIYREMIGNSGTLWQRYEGGFAHMVSPMLGQASPSLGEMTVGQILQRGSKAVARGDVKESYGTLLNLSDKIKMIQWADSLAARTAWSARRMQAALEHPEWDDATQMKWVTDTVNRDIARTQNSASVTDTSNFARNNRHNGFWSSMTMFTSDNNKQANLLLRALNLKDKQQASKIIGGVVANQLWSTAMRLVFRYGPAVAVAWLLGKPLDKKKYPELKSEATWQAVKTVAASMYGGQELAQVTKDVIQKNTNQTDIMSPPLQVATELVSGLGGVLGAMKDFGTPLKTGPNAGQDKGWKNLAKNSYDLALALMTVGGLAVVPVVRMAKKTSDAASYEEPAPQPQTRRKLPAARQLPARPRR